jgi:hypothetical protein
VVRQEMLLKWTWRRHRNSYESRITSMSIELMYIFDQRLSSIPI